MYPPRLPQIYRALPLIRPLRPPAHHSSPPKSRLFTQNSQLLLVGPTPPRPQLPFLSPVTQRSGTKSTPLQSRGGQWQLSRLVTTETKKSLKEGLWLGGKYTVIFWVTGFLLFLIAFGVQNEFLERQYPSPPQWTWLSRWNYRYARSLEEDDEDSANIIDWSLVGNPYLRLVERLESPDVDGKGLSQQADGGVMVPGVGSTGFDISGKPYPWRRGYCLALMGAARCAEQLDGWVTDETRKINFPPDVVIGPSNPRPRPVRLGAASPPLEQNCVPAYPPPERFYMKILTTQGFTDRERLEAAIAYSDWLDLKGLHDSAEEMCKWGIDIAAAPLAVPVAAIIDTDTSVLLHDAPATHLTPNILLATTSLAIHHVRSSNLSTAVPILLSVLRARRSRSPSPFSTNDDQDPLSTPSGTDGGTKNLSNILSFIQSWLLPPPYPPPVPSGNDPAHRTPASICLEAGLMSHIGEILFASRHYNDGLAWTRDAVDVAEAQLRELSTDLGASASPNTSSSPSPSSSTNGDIDEGDGAAVDRCTECLKTGMANWKMMVLKLASDEEKRNEDARAKQEHLLQQQQQQQQYHGSLSIWRWLWPTGNQVADFSRGEGEEAKGKGNQNVKGRWVAELEVVERRSGRAEELLTQERRRRRKERRGPVQRLLAG
ncbi:MAG: hypothetical protein M1837_006721 [Sclerophora amabilis]|nr:MAG: hypothetical protein M1837_006721 [Sclerophora amabilis]